MVIQDMWAPTGVILGFQMTIFSWRLTEERKVGYNHDIPWLTPSDYMNLVGMLTLVFGSYLLPLMELIDVAMSKVLFGLGVFLFIGQAIGMAAHYQLFNRTKKRKFVWFPLQEKIAIIVIIAASIIYLIIASTRIGN